MTRDELQAALKKFGLDIENFAESVRDKLAAAIDAEKAKLDTETRRKVRAFWIGVSAVFFVLGAGIGYSLARIFS